MTSAMHQSWLADQADQAEQAAQRQQAERLALVRFALELTAQNLAALMTAAANASGSTDKHAGQVLGRWADVVGDAMRALEEGMQ